MTGKPEALALVQLVKGDEPSLVRDEVLQRVDALVDGGDRSIMVEPLLTKTRLSPCKGTMSATVPSATKSSAVFKSKSMRRVFKRA